jgi:selenocysteine lyase/cysteine desulfurase
MGDAMARPNPAQVYGPHISQLYSHQRILPTLATLGHYFNPSTTLADRIGLAGSSYELTAALPAVVEYLTGATAGDMHARIAAHEGRLQAVLLQFLRARDDVVLYGEGSADPAVRVPTVSFSVRGWEAQAVVEEVEAVEGRVGIRAGHMYAKRLVDEVLGAKGGVVRISLVHYNTGTSTPF